MLRPVNLPRELSLRLLRDMVRIRRFEEKCAELYGAEKIRGFLRLYIGEEAVATGAIHALQPEDAIVATNREHGHALVRGVSTKAIMAEMYGKREGWARRWPAPSPRPISAPRRRWRNGASAARSTA